MDEFIKISAKTVEDAVIEASIQLGTSSDNIEYNVIEKETKGFLGLGARKALIEARRKKSDEDLISEIFEEKKQDKAPRAHKENNRQVKESTSEKKKAEEKPSEKKKAEDKPAEKKKTEEKAAEKKRTDEKPVEKKKTEEKTHVKKTEISEAPEKKIPEKKSQDKESIKTPRVPADPKVAIQRAEDFLGDMFKAMGLEVTLKSTFEDDTLSVDIEGDDMGVLIGKRGQTLDSIQYLCSLVVNKGKASYVRVKLDTEDYRNRRKATLENLAHNIALKVKKTRKPVYLEPMNPYERRIIHSALQSDPYVTTHSEGEEPARKVVVMPKRRERNYNSRREHESEE